MVRNLIDLYIYDNYQADFNEAGVIETPWKRWENVTDKLFAE